MHMQGAEVVNTVDTFRFCTATSDIGTLGWSCTHQCADPRLRYFEDTLVRGSMHKIRHCAHQSRIAPSHHSVRKDQPPALIPCVAVA